MPIRRLRRRPAARPRRARFARRKMQITRNLGSAMPVFTETLSFHNISVPNAGVGGVLDFAFGDIPEVVQYQTLYRTFRILKAQVILVPDQNMGQNFASPAAGGSSAVARLAYAVNDSAALPAPANELDVLVDNGAKIRMLTKPVKISCRPQPHLVQTGVVVNSTRNQWIDIDTGIAVRHNGISYWFSNGTSGVGSDLTVNVYCKLTFQLKDPR